MDLTFATCMNAAQLSNTSRPVVTWLSIGIAMLVIQVMLGGITRLTGSGLSITEWKPIMGTLPPMNGREWNESFDKYKHIAQFKYLNSSFTLSEYKSIFFWEWFHRLWARLMFVAFAIPFTVFLIRRQIRREMVRPLLILLLLGALQGLVGWIMVMSGLNEENLYVSHYRLAIHFILALLLICYTLWFTLELAIPAEMKDHRPGIRRFTGWIIFLLVIQLIYGAFMAGLKAAAAAPTWPDINGSYFAHGGTPGGFRQLFDNPITVQFIHRNLAYLIVALLLVWFISTRKLLAGAAKKAAVIPLIVVLLQVGLGIATVLNAPFQKRLVWLGAIHQFTAMVLLLALVFEFFLLSGRRRAGL
jgi:heme a synthase